MSSKNNNWEDEGFYARLPIEVQMCRFCGRVGPKGSNALLRLYHPSEHQIVIRMIRRELAEFWRVKIGPNDRLPKHICQSCYIVFDSYFSFRDNYLESQITLSSIYEELIRKEIEKSKLLTMKSPAKEPMINIMNDRLLQRNKLYSIISDHNYLGNYTDFLKIYNYGKIKEKPWKVKLNHFANDKSSGESDESWSDETEIGEEKCFTDICHCQTDEDYLKEVEINNFTKITAIDSQCLIKEITGGSEKQLETYKSRSSSLNDEDELFFGTARFQSYEENYDEIDIRNSKKRRFEIIADYSDETKSNDEKELFPEIYSFQTDEENVDENQSLDEKINNSVELTHENVLSAVEYKHDRTMIGMQNELKEKSMFSKFSPDRWNDKSETNASCPINGEGIIINNEFLSEIKGQTDQIVMSNASTEFGSKQCNATKTEMSQDLNEGNLEAITKTQIARIFGETNAVEFDVFDNSVINSDENESPLQVTIFIQEKIMETQMKSEIEKQILNLVDAKTDEVSDAENNKERIMNVEQEKFIIENSTDKSFFNHEEIKPTQILYIHSERNMQNLSESNVGDFENTLNDCLEFDTSSSSSSDSNRNITVGRVQSPSEKDYLTISFNPKEETFDRQAPSDSSEYSANKFLKGNNKTMDAKKQNQYRVPFSCQFCVSDPDLLSRHDCHRYPTEEALAEHVRTDHDLELPYSCLICKKMFRLYTTCRRHVFYSHKKPNVVCEICGVNYPAVKINEHMERSHTIGDYTCEICNKEFKKISLAKFKYHQKWHNQKQQVQCTYCNKSFVQQSHLQEHITEQHTKEYKIKCEICEAGFSTQFKKYVHMAKMHDGEKPLKCLYCDQRFLGYKLRVRHMIAFHNHIHNKTDQPSRCLICKKVFGNERGLSIHESAGCTGSLNQENNAENIYSCGDCPRKFRSKATLTRHRKYHSKQGRPFHCELCSLNYETKLDLLNHKCVQFPK